METVKPGAETSGFVEVFTTVLPFVLLAVVIAIIIALVYIYKLVKRYIDNGKRNDQRLKMDRDEMKEIKQRLERIEKILDDVE